MGLVEIQMNRIGINSIELTTKETEVSAGTALHVRITNYGAPTHVTLKTDGSAYTIFTYENIYLEAETEVSVPISADAPAGSFAMKIISGYGLRKEEFTVNVIAPEDLPTQPTPMKELMAAELQEAEGEVETKTPQLPLGTRRLLVAAILPVLTLIFLLLWVFLFPGLNAVIVAAIIYVSMLAEFAITWLSAR